MARARVVVVGSSNIDMVIKTERIPGGGETVLGGEFCMVPGGKGITDQFGGYRNLPLTDKVKNRLHFMGEGGYLVKTEHRSRALDGVHRSKHLGHQFLVFW